MQNPFPAPATTDGFQTLNGTCSTNEQIHLFDGNMLLMTTLVNVPTIGMPLSFSIAYNALDSATTGEMGYGWRHNYMMSLQFVDAETTIFVDETGRQYGFVLLDGIWIADNDTLNPGGSHYYFFGGTLSQLGASGWKISFADGSSATFDNDGKLTNLTDAQGNVTTLTAGSDSLTIQEPTGRTLLLTYSSGLVSSVTDPNGNTTSFSYTSNNLTTVTGPTGCVHTYAYDDMTHTHLLTSHTDPRSNAYTYAYNSDMQLETATDAESHSLSYAYDTVSETTPDGTTTFSRTTLTDARGYTWQYRFDAAGNLMRIIDPLNHRRDFAYDSNQRMIYSASGFPYTPTSSLDDSSPGPNNNFQYTYTNAKGNVLSTVDSSGRINNYTHDVTQQTQPARANVSIQGEWVGHYGADGYVLCGFNTDATDVVSLPAYITSVTPTSYSRNHLGDDDSSYTHLLDPRAMLSPTSMRRSIGNWEGDGTSLQITIQPSEAKTFNLSIYTNCADQTLALPDGDNPYQLAYSQSSGRDLTFTVVDQNGTRRQTFRAPNTAAGPWITFPVQGDTTSTGAITVTVTSSNSATNPVVSSLAFDPYYDRSSQSIHDGNGNIIGSVNGLGNNTQSVYTATGLTLSTTDSNGNVTTYSYDPYGNQSTVEDATSGITTTTYDLNGNRLSVKDPNGNVTTYTYDSKNRLISTRDGNGNVTSSEYDNNGNLASSTDANGNSTTYEYTADNRLWTTTDANSNTTTTTYDETGNVASVEDRLSRITYYAYDPCGRPSVTTLPDGNKITYTYDAMDRQCAVSSPNGNQSDLSDINLTGAANWMPNASAGSTDPNTPADPLYWINNTSGSGLDTNVPSGATDPYSLKLSLNGETPYWSQSQIPIPPGASGVFNFWAAPDGGASESEVWGGFLTRDVYGSISEAAVPSTPHTLPASSSAWAEIPLQAFQISATNPVVPGDSQFPRFGLEEFRAHGSGSSEQNVWFDNFALYVLSVNYSFDANGNTTAVIRPDGSVTRSLYDHLGRLASTVDARGRITTQQYDALDRLIQFTDPLGNSTSYTYDANGNRASTTDPNNNTITYAYDAMNRLTTITYPDESTEQYTYDDAGNIHMHTNNNGLEKTFSYDNSNRLTAITYASDSSHVIYAHDANDNIVSLTDRNGDVAMATYDKLNQLVELHRLPNGTGGADWLQVNTYDAEGNRTEFADDAAIAEYGVAYYGSDDYTTAGTNWSASGSYDNRNRLPGYVDRNDNAVIFGYDVESNRTSITFPTGTTMTTTATFDVTSKPLSLVTEASSTVMSLDYGYDLAGNRLSMVTDTDTFDYHIDDARQLVQEDINRFVENGTNRFALGTVDRLQMDQSTGTLTFLGFADTFGSISLDADRWRVACSSANWLNGIATPGYVGLQAQQNNGLAIAFPRGYSNVNITNNWPFQPDTYGFYPDDLWIAFEHRAPLSGDFDVQVNFAEYQGQPDTLDHSIGLWVGHTHYQEEQVTHTNSVFVGRSSLADSSEQSYVCRVYAGGTVESPVSVATTDASGKLRITRSGSNFATYYWNGSEWVSFSVPALSGLTSSSMWLAIVSSTESKALGSVLFSDLVGNSPTPAYPESGTYTSAVYNAGRSVTWSNITWTATTPGGTSLSFQVFVSDSPTMSSPTISTTMGSPGVIEDVDSDALVGQYAYYQVTFSGSGSATPTLSDVELSFSGANTSQKLLYGYDAAGNMTSRAVVTDSGTVTSESRTVNNLNQITQNVIGNTTWTLAYAGGNLTSKTPSFPITGTLTSGSNNVTSVSGGDIAQLSIGFKVAHADLPSGTTISTISASSFTVSHNATGSTTGATITVTGSGTSYTWDDDDRLTHVSLPDGSTVSYIYDAQDRMLTRKLSSDDNPSFFEWDGSALARETEPGGAVRIYYAPQGELLTFDRTSDGTTTTYCAINDALGSVRKVIDLANSEICSLDYDAWGNLLESASDTFPGGLSHRYVGSLSVRWDLDTELYYMQARWYDPTLQRFISRDPLDATNRYKYAKNQPQVLIDPLGTITALYLNIVRNDEDSILKVVPNWTYIYSELQSICPKWKISFGMFSNYGEYQDGDGIDVFTAGIEFNTGNPLTSYAPTGGVQSGATSIYSAYSWIYENALLALFTYNPTIRKMRESGAVTRAGGTAGFFRVWATNVVLHELGHSLSGKPHWPAALGGEPADWKNTVMDADAVIKTAGTGYLKLPDSLKKFIATKLGCCEYE